jgi:hypothetical protein
MNMSLSPDSKIIPPEPSGHETVTLVREEYLALSPQGSPFSEYSNHEPLFTYSKSHQKRPCSTGSSGEPLPKRPVEQDQDPVQSLSQKLLKQQSDFEQKILGLFERFTSSQHSQLLPRSQDPLPQDDALKQAKLPKRTSPSKS